MAHEHIYVHVTSFASSSPAGPFPQLCEMLDKPSSSRSDARKKRRAVGSAATEEEGHRVAARRLFAHPKPQPHGHVFAGLLFHGRVYLNAGLCFGQVVRGLVVSRKPIRRECSANATPRFDARVQPAPYVHRDVRFFLVPRCINVDRPAQAQVAGLLYVVSTIQAVRSPALVVNDPGRKFQDSTCAFIDLQCRLLG